MNDFIAPENDMNFNEEPYKGSFQQILAENIGLEVRADFLIGTNNVVSQTGIIYSVGTRYFVLFQPARNNYIVCDIFAVKFVTFINASEDTVRRR